MNAWKAQHVLENIGFKLSVSNPGLDQGNEKTALVMGAAALDKQIGKLPNNHNAEKHSFECPSCAKTIIYLDEKERHKHCLNCSQKLQWH